MRNYSHFEENTGVEIFFTTTSWNLVYSYNPPLLTCSSTDNIYLNVFNLNWQAPKQETRIVKEYYDKKNNRGAQYTIKGQKKHVNCTTTRTVIALRLQWVRNVFGYFFGVLPVGGWGGGWFTL